MSQGGRPGSRSPHRIACDPGIGLSGPTRGIGPQGDRNAAPRFPQNGPVSRDCAGWRRRGCRTGQCRRAGGSCRCPCRRSGRGRAPRSFTAASTGEDRCAARPLGFARLPDRLVPFLPRVLIFLDRQRFASVLFVGLSLAGEPGFEPGPTDSESAVLPLNYSPIHRSTPVIRHAHPQTRRSHGARYPPAPASSSRLGLALTPATPPSDAAAGYACERVWEGGILPRVVVLWQQP